MTAAREGRLACFRVADTGIGIAAEHLGGIFEMFAQVAPAMRRNEGGLGIGLALVRGFVELHGGKVEARSAGLGHGSEFIVRVPLLDAVAIAPRAPALLVGPSVLVRRVLVVDDNRDAASSLRALLELAGHDVREAHGGQEGLRVAFEFEPDVILLDIGMPGMNGLEVAREIRKQAIGARVRLIAVTGWGQAQDRQLTREAGFDFHLTKPVDHAELAALLSIAFPPVPAPSDTAMSIRH